MVANRVPSLRSGYGSDLENRVPSLRSGYGGTSEKGYKIETNSASKYFRLFYGAMDETHLTTGRDVACAGRHALMVATEPQAAHHERRFVSVSHPMGDQGRACALLQRRTL